MPNATTARPEPQLPSGNLSDLRVHRVLFIRDLLAAKPTWGFLSHPKSITTADQKAPVFRLGRSLVFHKVRISGIVVDVPSQVSKVEDELVSYLLDDGTGIAEVRMPRRLQVASHTRQLVKGVHVDVLGHVFTKAGTAPLYVRCDGFSITSDVTTELLRSLETIRLYREHYFTLSTAKEATTLPSSTKSSSIPTKRPPDDDEPFDFATQRDVLGGTRREFPGMAHAPTTEDDEFMMDDIFEDTDLEALMGAVDAAESTARSQERSIPSSPKGSQTLPAEIEGFLRETSGATEDVIFVHFPNESATSVRNALAILAELGSVYQMRDTYHTL
ncbi:hypothetical protein HKX48_004315 [Thoreauomyces humboldtii]|nr:hypothetical protein HKX48_004315 [Thoreauomyces humboldtii]